MDNRITFLRPLPRGVKRAGFLLGFSLGGFFDGILLHQVLQWHHLLSGLGRPPFDDLRVQILADGLFHAAMYVVAAAGVWKLLQARYALVDRASDRMLVAGMLTGFGSWHIADAVLSHWVLGLHRIRMDVPDPLAWDVLWFLLFGVLFVVAGIVLQGRPPAPHGGERRRRERSTHAPLLAGAVLLAGLAAAAGGRGQPDAVTVLLRPGATPAGLLAGLGEVDGRVLWSSARGDVWVFSVGRNARPARLYAHGALLVSGTLLPAGCSAWIRA